MPGIVCDKRMPIMLKAAAGYKTVVRPVLMYGSETLALRKAEQNLLERTEMRMLRWMRGLKRIEKIRKGEISARAGVANIRGKIREAKLRWLGHVERQTEEDVVMRTWTMEVGGHRKIGRPKLRWSDVIRKDRKEKQVKIEEAQDRRTWRLETWCADPKEGKRRRGSVLGSIQTMQSNSRTLKYYKVHMIPGQCMCVLYHGTLFEKQRIKNQPHNH